MKEDDCLCKKDKLGCQGIWDGGWALPQHINILEHLLVSIDCSRHRESHNEKEKQA